MEARVGAPLTKTKSAELKNFFFLKTHQRRLRRCSTGKRHGEDEELNDEKKDPREHLFCVSPYAVSSHHTTPPDPKPDVFRLEQSSSAYLEFTGVFFYYSRYFRNFRQN